MPPFPSITGRFLPFIEKYFCPILAFVGCPVGFHLLRRNQDFKELFGAKEEALVDAFLSAAEYLVPFLCFCILLIPQMKDKCKNFLPHVFLNCLSLAVPAIMGHLAEYSEFQIKVKDVKQHNSRKIKNLYTSFVFAITSWAFSKTYGLSFECGFFSGCLGYAMLVSLAIVDKTGNSRDIRYILGTYIACFLLILLRKYLEIDEGSDTARQRDDHSSSDRKAAAGQIPSASGTTNLQASQTESSGGSAPIQPEEVPDQVAIGISEDSNSDGKDGSSRRDASQKLRGINNIAPPRIQIDTSSSCEDTEDSHEVSGQENSHEEQGEGDMRSSPSSIDMEITAGRFGSGGCEKDYDHILLPKSSILIKGDKDDDVDDYSDHDSSDDERSDGDGDHSHTGKGWELGVVKDPDLVHKDDGDDSSDDKGSDGDGFHSGTGCKPGVGEDPNLEEESLKVDKDDDHNSNDKKSDTAGQSPSASEITDLQFSQTESSVGSALNQPIEVSKICGDRTSEGLMGKGGSSRKDARRGSWDINEHHRDSVPTRISIKTSSSCRDTEDGEEEEDVPHVSQRVAQDIMTTHSKKNKTCFAEVTSAVDDRVDKIEESEVPGNEGQGDTRSSTLSGDMEIAVSFGLGAYEEDYAPLDLPSRYNITDGEVQTVNVGLGQTERSQHEIQESGSQGHEKDGNLLLLMKVDDDNSEHESSDEEVDMKTLSSVCTGLKEVALMFAMAKKERAIAICDRSQLNRRTQFKRLTI